MIEFDNYSDPVINIEGKEFVLILSIRYSWEGKREICSHLQVPICLVWAITIYKSQGLTLKKTMINLEKNEYAARLLFVAISQVYAFQNIIFRPFSLEKLQHIKTCKRL